MNQALDGSLRGRFVGYIHWNPSEPPAQLFPLRRTENETLSRATTDEIFSWREKDRSLTDKRDSFAPDCGFAGVSSCFPMHASPQLILSEEDKLDILRKLDEFHFWHSLDDRRFCKQCGRAISGWEIEVIESAGARGKMRLRCPTEGCVSTPGDWVYADPVLAASLRREFRSFGSPPPPPREDISLTHRRQVVSVRRARHRYNEHAATISSRAQATPWPLSFRAMLARLPMLRPLATGLHAFRPIA